MLGTGYRYYSDLSANSQIDSEIVFDSISISLLSVINQIDSEKVFDLKVINLDLVNVASTVKVSVDVLLRGFYPFLVTRPDADRMMTA